MQNLNFNDQRPAANVPPIQAALTASPEGAKVWSAVRANYLTVYGAVNDIAAILSRLEAQLIAIESDTTRVPGWRVEQSAQARNAAGQQVETVAAKIKAAHDQIAVQCESIALMDDAAVKAVKPVDRFSTGDPAMEIALATFWTDWREALDRISDDNAARAKLDALISEAGRGGDDLAMWAFRRSGRAYMARRGYDMTAEQWSAHFDQLAAPFFSPTQRAARDVLTDVAANYGNVEAALQYARQQTSDKPGGMKLTDLVGWNGQRAVISGVGQMLAQ